MKQAILICLSLCLYTFVQAQDEDYIPNHPQYFSDGDAWAWGEMIRPQYLEEGYWADPDNFWVGFNYYFIDGDTIVDGYQYWKVYLGSGKIDVVNHTASGLDKFLIKVWSKPHFSLLIREDESGCQYLRAEYFGGEYMLWDFSEALEIGNTIRYNIVGMGWTNTVVIRINDIGTYELVDGTEVPLVNNQYIWGYGEKNLDYLLHFWGDSAVEDGRAEFFYFRNHNGNRVHENEMVYPILTERLGIDLEELVQYAFFGEPTNIETVKDEKTSDALYDLQGRRLAREPEKGLYIKDGRKYLKK